MIAIAFISYLLFVVHSEASSSKSRPQQSRPYQSYQSRPHQSAAPQARHDSHQIVTAEVHQNFAVLVN